MLLKKARGSAGSIPLCSGEGAPVIWPHGVPWARFSPASAPLVALVSVAMPRARRDPPAPHGGSTPGRLVSGLRFDRAISSTLMLQMNLHKKAIYTIPER